MGTSDAAGLGLPGNARTARMPCGKPRDWERRRRWKWARGGNGKFLVVSHKFLVKKREGLARVERTRSFLISAGLDSHRIASAFQTNRFTCYYRNQIRGAGTWLSRN